MKDELKEYKTNRKENMIFRRDKMKNEKVNKEWNHLKV